MQKLTLKAAVAALALCSLAATAQTYPSKLISMVVPFTAGGPADADARAAQPLLQRQLGQNVIVENYAGAGGSIGVARVLGLPADGHSLLMATVSEPILPPLTLPSVKYVAEDLRLVSQLSYTYLALITRPGLKFKDVNELLAYARNPANKELSYATPGNGTLFHLVSEHFKQQTGARMVHVPYKGLAPAFNDLMGNQVDVAFVPLAGNVPGLIEAGKVRALGTTSAARVPQAKDLPSLNEGPALKNFVYTVWTGVFVPRATPEPVVQKLHGALDAVLKGPEYRAFIRDTGGIARDGAQSLPEAAQFYQSEVDRLRSVFKLVKLEVQ
ncbi:tripartite tricarboxylate transporter substrate binding protein [Variovorax terrae]|uniref:Tripartite tricarboxylate transporter substrate binding protein n=1 Tax=Variovorax terrae TaxID=2923278 RepID=A0A9X1VX30_9BURK|nr:tripartite tricarboxylate transporter substrate binding protein [Variovorax terrae]MCJ0765421.1 tripartite tricarboxylate transporter substrate binding protein [Variovorax terrae]